MAIFISYRREDSEGDARALYNRLVQVCGQRHLFLDFEGISGGDDWRARINETLAKVNAVLVVIGPEWLDILKARSAAGGPDHVQEEIAACLAKPSVRVVPVLIKGARMPAAEALPGDIRALAAKNAMEVRGAMWTEDVDRLVRALRQANALPISARQRWIRYVAPAALVAVAAAGAASFFLARVPTIPPRMKYAGAERLLENQGLRAIPKKPPRDYAGQGVHVVVAQRPAPGNLVFRGRAVEVDIENVIAYRLICRGGGLFSRELTGDVFEFGKHDGPASISMKEGTCSWVDRKLGEFETSTFRAIGMADELRKKFQTAPLKIVSICAFSDKDLRLVALDVVDYLDQGGTKPVERFYICDERVK